MSAPRRSLGIGAGMVVAVLGSPAQAGPRPSERSAAALGSKTDPATGKAEPASSVERKRQNKNQARKDKRGGGKAEDDAPPLTSYQIELELRSRESKIIVDRKRGIALLEEFIGKHADNRAMPEALYRLAALYWERSQEQFLAAMEAWAKTVDGCRDAPESCPNGPPVEPQLDLRNAQTLYARLIGEYPGFRKLDTVRYLYAFSLRDQGKTDEAQAQFRAIIEKHPSSTFVPDAWLAIGDHRFYASNDWGTALVAYEHVLEYPSSESYAMALFKSAWCHWKLGHSQDAIRRFKEVLDQGSEPATDEAGRKRLADLREEALEYLVQVISEDEKNTPKDIYAFLASIDGTQYSRKVLVRLAEAYEAQTRYDKSVPTWRFLVELDPQHPSAADCELHVFTGLRGDGKLPAALDELATVHQRYGPSTPWAKAHPKPARRAHAEAAALLFELGRSIHEGAQAAEKDTKVADKERYALAARAYDDFIGRYPSDDNSVEVSYLVGDIYFFKLAQLERAGDAYLRVGESAPVGKLHHDALLAAISAYEQAMVLAPREPAAETVKPVVAKPEAGGAAAAGGATATEGTSVDPAAEAAVDPPTPEQYDPLERKFIRAVDLFSSLFPKDEQNGAVLFSLGEFFYNRGDYDGAVQRFGKVVVEYPESANAGASGDRILESLQKADDYDNIELWAGKLKGSKAFSAQTEQQRLDRIIVESMLKQGDTLVDRGYAARAASYYLRVAKEYPKHDKAALALGNAGAALERAKKPQAATEVYERLARDYPSSAPAADATLVVARVYENMGDYERAAQRYDEFVERHPRRSERADALYNAGVLYEGLGKPKLAAARYGSYAKQYTDQKDSLQVELRVGMVQARAGDHKAAAASLSRFVERHGSAPESVEAGTALGKSLIVLGKLDAADKALARAAKAGRTADGQARIAGAEARYLQAELVHRQFEASKLDPKPAKLGQSLDRKAKLLAQAKDIYLDVLPYSTAEWTTAALFRIGESYEQFAKGLRDYPIPKGLSQDQQDAYSEQLGTFALAFEEEAIGAYKSGYARAMELGIYNTYTKRIREALGRLSGQEFPPIAEIGTELRAAEGAASGAQAVRRLTR
jgi:cellulose synthase operon protein C